LCVLVFGSGYERIADTTCSDRTLRRRRDEWTALGVMQQLWHLALAAYDRMVGLELSDLAIDARGIPLGVVPAAASRNDHTLLGATLDALDALGRMGPFPELRTVHLDRCYDYQVVREVLAERGLLGQIAQRACPHRCSSATLGHRAYPCLGNTFGKLPCCTERRRQQVEFYLVFACAVIVVRALIGRARLLYRWDARPTARRLR
jgi:hypothetical protein